jgi:hypothetical protein
MRRILVKLNMWKRLGIVLSGLWLVIMPIWVTLHFANQHAETARIVLGRCLSDVTQTPAQCSAQFQIYDRFEFGMIWSESLLTAIACAAIMWAVVYGVVFSVRWILAGRNLN